MVDLTMGATAPSPEELVLAVEQTVLVQRVMVQMEREAPELAEVLWLFGVEGLSLEDAAGRLGVGPAEVADRLRRAQRVARGLLATLRDQTTDRL
jgi:DNA-directed RNA polymerase specialized sigma24 family protein